MGIIGIMGGLRHEITRGSAFLPHKHSSGKTALADRIIDRQHMQTSERIGLIGLINLIIQQSGSPQNSAMRYSEGSACLLQRNSARVPL